MRVARADCSPTAGLDCRSLIVDRLEPNPHPEVQGFEPIKPPAALLFHVPTLPPKHRMDPLTSKSSLPLGNHSEAVPQGSLVFRLTLAAVSRAAEATPDGAPCACSRDIAL